MKITTSLFWGGAIDGETLLDVLAKIKKQVPSAMFAPIEAYPNHSGGWPIFEIEFAEDEMALMAEAFEMPLQDFADDYFG